MKQIAIFIFLVLMGNLFSNCSSTQPIQQKSVDWLEVWKLEQLRKYSIIQNKNNADFVCFGLGSGATLFEAQNNAENEATFQMPELVNLHLVTIVEIANITNVTNSSSSEITIREIEFEELSNIFYKNKYYSAKIGKKNKETFFDEQGLLSEISNPAANSFPILVENQTETSQQTNLSSNSKDPAFQKWENEQNIKYAELLKTRVGEILGFAIGVSENEDASFQKAKFYAALLLPEKQSVFVQSVTDVMLAKNQKCVVNRSKISECIKNIKYETIGKFNSKGVYSNAVIAILSRSDLYKSMNNGVKELESDGLINANEKYNSIILGSQKK